MLLFHTAPHDQQDSTEPLAQHRVIHAGATANSLCLVAYLCTNVVCVLQGTGRQQPEGELWFGYCQEPENASRQNRADNNRSPALNPKYVPLTAVQHLLEKQADNFEQFGIKTSLKRGQWRIVSVVLSSTRTSKLFFVAVKAKCKHSPCRVATCRLVRLLSRQQSTAVNTSGRDPLLRLVSHSRKAIAGY